MKKSLVLLVVLVLAIGGIGFWRGWFNVSSQRHSSGEKVDLSLTIDEGKVKEDAEAASEKTAELTSKISEEVRELGGKARDRIEGDRDDNNQP